MYQDWMEKIPVLDDIEIKTYKEMKERRKVMSRTIIYNKGFEYGGQKIENMDLCKWLIDDVCCNEKSDCLGDYPYPRSICENEYGCGCFEKEDGVIEEDK